MFELGGPAPLRLAVRPNENHCARSGLVNLPSAARADDLPDSDLLTSTDEAKLVA